MDNQVTVTFTALNEGFSIAKRHITLNNEQNSVPVGRASKSVTKGILGARDNAWFDSPVMSRNHAELELNAEDMTLTIKDIGSMHGTYLNDIELPKHSPMVVTDGDVLVFGAEVRRGPETFPACKLRINYKFLPYKAANTFTFPESSDVEDEGEHYDEFSEDDMNIEGHEHQYSSEDGVSIESLPRKSSHVVDAIDLTGDDHSGASPINRVDLTGESEIPTRTVNLVDDSLADFDENTDPTVMSNYAGSIPIVVDTEDEDAEFDSDLDNPSNDSESEMSFEDSGLAHPFFDDDSDEISESENEGPGNGSEAGSNAGLGELRATDIDPLASVVTKNLIRYAVAADSNPVVRLSDVRTRMELPDSGDEESDSDIGLSEAGAEGMKALYGESSSNINEDAPEWGQEEDNLDENNGDGVIDTHSPQVFTLSSLEQNFTPSVSQASVESTPQTRANAFESMLSQPAPSVRQPSPSDAAMAKSNVPTKSVGVCDLGETGMSTSLALGEKSGKSAFFAAREINKSKFSAGNRERTSSNLRAANKAAGIFIGGTISHRPDPPKEISSVFTLPAAPVGILNKWEEPILERSPMSEPADTIMFDSFAAEQPIPLPVGSLDTSKFPKRITSVASLSKPALIMPTRDFCSFLDTPDQSPLPNRAPSPLPDMTSSVIYNTSKDSMKAASIPKQNPRSAIKIPDIIESSSPLICTNNLKRKSENISDVSDKELRDWARSNVSDCIDTPACESRIPVRGHVSKNAPATSDTSGSRPTKRIKKLLENVGYVALGGATLFAALVATAPNL